MIRSDQVALRELRRTYAEMAAAADQVLGFPGATDIDYRPTMPFQHRLVNNVGDPAAPALYKVAAREKEMELVAMLGDLFRAPADDRWGYVTSGGSEGNLYGLLLARTKYPAARVYHSTASHYSVPKACHLLNLPATVVPTRSNGELDYAALEGAVARHPGEPAIVVTNVGTTMTEAVDDLIQVQVVLDRVGVRDRYIHADGALSALPLALMPSDVRPAFDFHDGADSISLSGHKFMGTPMPCGMVLTRRTLKDLIAQPVRYLQGNDSTITGSRNGHAVLALWYGMNSLGVEELTRRAVAARVLARYTHAQLKELGWSSWMNPAAFTVVLRTPPAELVEKWSLATADGWSHIICMPGVTRSKVDAFLGDLAEAMGIAAPVEMARRGSRRNSLERRRSLRGTG